MNRQRMHLSLSIAFTIVLAFGVAITGLAAIAEGAPDLTNVFWNQVNGNFFFGNLQITSQFGNTFSGTIYGDVMSGTITGSPPNPVTIVFTRFCCSEPQIWTGSYSEVPSGADTAVMMAGVFYHLGLGPSPWFVTGRRIG